MKLLRTREVPILIFTILVFAAFSALSSNFLTVGNVSLILTQITTIGLISIGMLMVILFGGIDLSVGAVLAIVATIVGMLVNSGVDPLMAALIGVLAGAACGALNGLLITRLNIPDIITTLATMFIFRGIAVAISNGQWVTNFPASFNFYGQGSIFGIPVPVIFLVLAAAIFWYILGHTAFGRRIYAIGGNPDAARLAGMKIKRTKLLVYVNSGILTSIAAITFASNVGNVQASTAGKGIEFTVIAAVLIGGASIFGGVGTLVGTMIGVLLMGIIKKRLSAKPSFRLLD